VGKVKTILELQGSSPSLFPGGESKNYSRTARSFSLSFTGWGKNYSRIARKFSLSFPGWGKTILELQGSSPSLFPGGGKGPPEKADRHNGSDVLNREEGERGTETDELDHC
jgi:hypothetical protein